jgi:predicted ABC-type ATPase
VEERVQNGGHGIPASDIEKRYIESFANLQYLLQECDLAVFMIIRIDLLFFTKVNW